MKKQTVFILAISAGLMLVLAFAFSYDNQASAAGFSLASLDANASRVAGLQQQGPGNPNGAAPTALDVAPYGQMSYQGQLLHNGVPYNGTIDITFRLYSLASGGGAFWTETQSVLVQSGVFSVMLGSVTPMNLLGNDLFQQAWLGIQPAGAVSELTPRQLLGATAYAFGLIPGATMVDSNPAGDYGYSFWVDADNHSAIYAETNYEDAVALYAYNSGVNGAGAGLPIAVNASTTANESVSVYARNSGQTSCFDPEICESALVAEVTNGAYGVASYTNERTLFIGRNTGTGFFDIFVQNTNAPGSGGIYTSSGMYVGGNLTVAGSKSGYVVDIALNDSSQTLERGDVVAISGYAEPVLGEIPVIRVQKANAETASGVVGIVDKLYLPCEKAPEELQAGEQCGGFVDSITTIEPGQYMAVVTLGAYGFLKVDVATGPVQAGDLLSISPVAGFAAPAERISVEGVSFYAPGTIIGKALGSPAPGSSYIPVFVTIR